MLYRSLCISIDYSAIMSRYGSVDSLFILLAVLPSPSWGRTYEQYNHLFPAWSGILEDIIKENCTHQMNDYLDRSNPDRQVPYYLIGCIMENFPEYRKAEIAMSSLVLGLIPITIQALSIGSSQLALLSIRRPLLPFLLAAGSTVLIPEHSAQFVSTVKSMKEPAPLSVKPGILSDAQTDRKYPIWVRRRLRMLVTISEYVLVLASVANVAVLAYQLSYWTVTLFAVRETFNATLWIYLSCLVHASGIITLYLRVSVPRVKGVATKSWWKTEFVPCAYGEPLRLRFRMPNYWFTMWSWFTFTAVTIHALYGVIILSALLFISQADTVMIMGRFVTSTVVCRAVVMYEIMGMREATSNVQVKPEEGVGIDEATNER